VWDLLFPLRGRHRKERQVFTKTQVSNLSSFTNSVVYSLQLILKSTVAEKVHW
jgi:hypothetical protein